MNRVAPLFAAALVVSALSPATFASPEAPSGDHGGAAKHPAGQPPSVVEDATRNVTKSAREAASIAKDVAQGAVDNTRQAVKGAKTKAPKPSGHAAPGHQP